MPKIEQRPAPADSLLRTFRAVAEPQAWDHYHDCFVTEVPSSVSLADYLVAFYGSLPFRLERWLIGVLVRKPSTAADVAALATGKTETFSAWRVLARTGDQILLGDFQNNTRSWLAVTARGNRTQLQFGSGIRAVIDPTSGTPTMSFGFKALGGFHVFYSRVLLRAAAGRLKR